MGEAGLPAAVALATGLLSCLATRGLIPILRRRGVLDHPNERSSHRVPTPRGGGIALVGSLLFAWAVLPGVGLPLPGLIQVSLGAGLLAIVSWVDDLRDLSPLPRLLAQVAAVTVGIFGLPEPKTMTEGLLASAIYLGAVTLVWIWWINLFNFMDGIDGIAGSEAAAIGIGLLAFAKIGVGADPALALAAAALVGAALGFLLWNWAPARVFLGDVGSAPLGYLIGFLLLDLAMRGFWKIALILPLYFLADASITLARRLLRGERIWQAHRQHFYQQAVGAGLSHAAIVERVVAANVVLIGCGWAAENGWGVAALIVSAATVAVLLTVLSRGR